MTLLDFVASVYHKRVTAPGGLGGQCVDLANVYLDITRSLAPIRANAVDWQRQRLPGFVWVVNRPTNAPLPGSLVVWGPDPRIGIGADGHIAIALAADSMHVLSLDQNWWVQQCIPVLHDYRAISGWHEPLTPLGG